MGDYKPVKGDRVRVVLEGVVSHDSGYPNEDDDGIQLLIDGSPNDTLTIGHSDVNSDGCTIEKIEPLVEVFGPGDVVRPRNESYRHLIYLLGANGYSFMGTSHGGDVVHERDPH